MTTSCSAAAGATPPTSTSSLASVSVSLAVGTATGQGTDTLEQIENVKGSAPRRLLTGDCGQQRHPGRQRRRHDRRARAATTRSTGAPVSTTPSPSPAPRAPVFVDLAGGVATGEGADTLSGLRERHRLQLRRHDHRRRRRQHADRRLRRRHVPARDGVVDTLVCGPGTDTAIVDAADDADADCETIDDGTSPTAATAPADDRDRPVAAPAVTVTTTVTRPRRRRSFRVRITGHPASTVKTKKTTARVTFTFSSSTNGASFKCSRDFGAFARCGVADQLQRQGRQAHVHGRGGRRRAHRAAGDRPLHGQEEPVVHPLGVTSAAFFDLDRTLMAGSSGFHWVRAAHSAGMVSRRQLASDAMTNIRFRLRGSTDEIARQAVARLDEALRGHHPREFQRLGPQVLAGVLPRLYPKMLDLAWGHQDAGRRVYIATAATQETAEMIATVLSFDGAVGTRLEVDRRRRLHRQARRPDGLPRGQGGGDRRGRPARRHRSGELVCLLGLRIRSADAARGRPPGRRQPRQGAGAGGARGGLGSAALRDARAPPADQRRAGHGRDDRRRRAGGDAPTLRRWQPRPRRPRWRGGRRRTRSRRSATSSFTTLGGEPIKPLYTRGRPAGHRRRSASRASIRSRAACTRRCTAGGCGRCASSPGFGTAEETNERFRYLLDHGQTGLSTAFDMPSLMGHDSDHPKSEGEVGREGVAVDTLDDMQTLFAGHRPRRGDGVDDDQRAGGDHARLLRRRRRASRACRPSGCGGTIQADILKEYIAQKEWCFPIDPAMRLLGDMIEWCSQQHAALAPGVDLRLPHPRGRLDGRPGARVHAQGRPDVRRSRRSTAASTSTTSRRGCRSSSTPRSTSSRRSPSTAPRGGSGRARCATPTAPRTRGRG